MQESNALPEVVMIEPIQGQGLLAFMRYAIIVPASTIGSQVPSVIASKVVERFSRSPIQQRLPLLLHLWQQDADGMINEISFENRLFHTIRFAIFSRSQDIR